MLQILLRRWEIRRVHWPKPQPTLNQILDTLTRKAISAICSQGKMVGIHIITKNNNKEENSSLNTELKKEKSKIRIRIIYIGRLRSLFHKEIQDQTETLRFLWMKELLDNHSRIAVTTNLAWKPKRWWTHSKVSASTCLMKKTENNLGVCQCNIKLIYSNGKSIKNRQ